MSQRTAIDKEEVEGTSGNYVSTAELEQCPELLGRPTNNSSRRGTVELLFGSPFCVCFVPAQTSPAAQIPEVANEIKSLAARERLGGSWGLIHGAGGHYAARLF